MKKAGFPIFLIAISVLLTLFIGIAEATKVVKVQIHTTVGGPFTEEQVRAWIAVANAIDGPNVIYVVDSNHVHPPGTKPTDANVNDKGRINIWGLPKCVVTGEPNYVSGAQPGTGIIELVPGHTPAGPNEPNVWIKPSTLAHELNELQGLPHSDDPNNKMYPDNEQDSNGVYHSCHRKGTNLTAEQRKILEDSNLPYIQYAVLSGAGNEVYDISGDVIDPNIDLFWTQGWLEYIRGQNIIHLAAEVDVVSFFDVWLEIGFYMNSDGDPSTGEQPDGFDCYLAYIPHYDEIFIQRWDSFWGWWGSPEPPPEGVSLELAYTNKDTDEPPVASGIRFTGPLNEFVPGMTLTGNFAFKAIAKNRLTQETDRAPDVGVLTIKYPPFPIPGDLNLDNKVDEADLEIMTWDWPEIGTSRADIFPLPGDGKVDFLDYAVLANNWLIEMP